MTRRPRTFLITATRFLLLLTTIVAAHAQNARKDPRIVASADLRPLLLRSDVHERGARIVVVDRNPKKPRRLRVLDTNLKEIYTIERSAVGGDDFLTAELDSHGALWLITQPMGFDLDADDGSMSFAKAGYDMTSFTLRKFDPKGKLLWRRDYKAADGWEHKRIALASDGNLLLRYDQGDEDNDWSMPPKKGEPARDHGTILLEKISPDGAVLWKREFSVLDLPNETGFGVDSSGGVHLGSIIIDRQSRELVKWIEYRRFAPNGDSVAAARYILSDFWDDFSFHVTAGGAAYATYGAHGYRGGNERIRDSIHVVKLGFDSPWALSFSAREPSHECIVDRAGKLWLYTNSYHRDDLGDAVLRTIDPAGHLLAENVLVARNVDPIGARRDSLQLDFALTADGGAQIVGVRRNRLTVARLDSTLKIESVRSTRLMNGKKPWPGLDFVGALPSGGIFLKIWLDPGVKAWTVKKIVKVE